MLTQCNKNYHHRPHSGARTLFFYTNLRFLKESGKNKGKPCFPCPLVQRLKRCLSGTFEFLLQVKQQLGFCFGDLALSHNLSDISA